MTQNRYSLISIQNYSDKAFAFASPGLGNTLLSRLQALNGDKPVFFQQAKFLSQ
jgi:hypothetical protein